MTDFPESGHGIPFSIHGSRILNDSAIRKQANGNVEAAFYMKESAEFCLNCKKPKCVYPCSEISALEKDINKRRGMDRFHRKKGRNAE